LSSSRSSGDDDNEASDNNGEGNVGGDSGLRGFGSTTEAEEPAASVKSSNFLWLMRVG